MVRVSGDSRRIAWLLFVFFQALYALTSSGNAFRVPDEFEVYYQVEHLVDAGDLSVAQAVPAGRLFGKIGIDGKPYAPYGPLAAVLFVPHHLIARGVARLAGIPHGTVTWQFVVSGVTMLGSSTAAALAVVGFYRAALLLDAMPAVALLLAMLLGGATMLWTYSSTLYSEAWQAAALIWAAVFLLERRVGPAALMLFVVVLTKATSLVFTPGLIVSVLVSQTAPRSTRIRAALVLLAAVATAVTVHLAWNQYRFGSPLEFGYDWAETVPVLPARAFLLNDLPRGLVVLLLTPGKSLLVWAPALWLALPNLRRWRHPLVAGVLTTTPIALIFYGAYLFPEGGYAHGARHLVPLVPLLLLPAAIGRPAWQRHTVVVCALIGFAMATLSVSISFLQDQGLGQELARTGYYERIQPAPGRAWNRYNLSYVPFARTIRSGDWPRSREVGYGLDVFPLHLTRARALIPEAGVIPGWLIWGLPAWWSAVLIVAGGALVGRCRQRRGELAPSSSEK